MAETTNEESKAPEVVKDEVVNTDAPATSEAETQNDEPKVDEKTETKAKATRKPKAKKQVNLDEEIKQVRPTFARGVQAIMRERIYAKGKK